VNAVEHFASLLPGDALRRLASLRTYRYESGGRGLTAPEPSRRDRDIDEARSHVCARWSDDLCGLLNALTHGELSALASARSAASRSDPRSDLRSPDLRALLWDRGAALERSGSDVSDIPASLQPRPILLGGHLVIQSPPRGLYPASPEFPRPFPPPSPPAPPESEPDSLDDLLSAADRALGVRLGARGRDKGAWGNRAAALLGIRERGDGEPDWRGDVEIKTVPISREPTGLWRVREDPAIAMVHEGNAFSKLVRTLWLARADLPGADSTIVSWYFLEQDAHISRLHGRYLHARPKGPAGTDQRGLYLHKRFFADAGLLATLNGPP
jgi:hypothetical protein